MSDTLTFEWDGLTEIAARYGRADRMVQEEMQDAADRTLGVASRVLARYPVPVVGSTYVRTGDLGRGWEGEPRYRIGRAAITAALENPVGYAEWVQGARQARVHQGRWITVKVVQEQIGRVYGPMYVREAIVRLARRLERG